MHSLTKFKINDNIIHMKINKAEFATSVADGKKIILDNKDMIAFVGRSNVGKSSLLNFLVNNKSLARTSSTPGRTRLINYFLINNEFYFVDLPGYGFAKGSKTESGKWDGLMDPFFTNTNTLKLVCILVDSRIKPTELDKHMITYLSYYQIPFIVIATKCDKLPKSKIKPAMQVIANELGLAIGNIYPCSSEKKTGKEEILLKFDQFIGENNDK